VINTAKLKTQRKEILTHVFLIYGTSILAIVPVILDSLKVLALFDIPWQNATEKRWTDM
jgi:hypothetical protein